MRFIPTWVHGMLDYPMSLLLIALPWIAGFADLETAKWISIGAGGVMLLLSGITAYEAGLLRLIPMPVHLMADAGLGILLAAAPWLFGFADQV
jgi:hypothetical protein